jgi:hypothetical protein
MKTILFSFIFLIFLNFQSLGNSDYIVYGTGMSKGMAYIEALSKAPIGNNWKIANVNYSSSNVNFYNCTIIWKDY